MIKYHNVHLRNNTYLKHDENNSKPYQLSKSIRLSCLEQQGKFNIPNTYIVKGKDNLKELNNKKLINNDMPKKIVLKSRKKYFLSYDI